MKTKKRTLELKRARDAKYAVLQFSQIAPETFYVPYATTKREEVYNFR